MFDLTNASKKLNLKQCSIETLEFTCFCSQASSEVKLSTAPDLIKLLPFLSIEVLGLNPFHSGPYNLALFSHAHRESTSIKEDTLTSSLNLLDA